MEWFIVSFCLASSYIAFVFFSQLLMNLYDLNPATVLVNVLGIAAAISFCIFPQEVRIPEVSAQYGLLLLIGFLLFLQNYFIQMGTKMPFNMGLIDGLAICIYLPTITFLFFVCFNEKLQIKKIMGICLACIAGLLMLS
jgi:hypothetical protein